MNQLKIVECKGFTKEEAFAKLNFDPNNTLIPGTNATQAWKKAGSPIVGTQDFKRFVTQQLQEKTKSQPGYGIHIVLDPPLKDIRLRPYTIVNNKATSTRDWKFVYWIREDILDVSSLKEQITDEYGDDAGTTENLVISVIEPGNIVEIAAAINELRGP